MLLYVQAESRRFKNMIGGLQSQQILWVSSLWEEHQKHSLVEGVVVVDDLMSDEFSHMLDAQVSALAEQRQAREDQRHSNHVVRQLVHPAFYSYIQGVTPLMAGVKQRQELGKDFWGRSYKASLYQWLPSYISISADGKCKYDTYINNLTPREDHAALYHSLETLLAHALPFIQSVLSYVYAVRPLVRYQERIDDLRSNYNTVGPMDMKFISLRGHKLQVVTEIVDYEFTPQHGTDDGVWHVEGMSHEEIVLTCLYMLDHDESIEGGEIEFKRAILRDEAKHAENELPIAQPPQHVDELVKEGLVPLGTVATSCGRLVLFPNTHVNRVREMQCRTDETVSKRSKVVAKRRIVVFYVVNPQRRIVSTREVAPQQLESGGKLRHEEAVQHGLALLAERKQTKQDWNVRLIEI
jgi:hypothetical protein